LIGHCPGVLARVKHAGPIDAAARGVPAWRAKPAKERAAVIAPLYEL